jgi:Mn2+/Fe2+ NRAMP family transporter
MIVAVLGTTISPYLFYWQASEEAEEEEDDPNASPLIQSDIRDTEALMRIKVDTTAGMALSNIIAAFIIISTAVTLHAHGITNIDTAAEAALALKPLAGDYAFLLFALGIIGTGLLALPVLAGSAAYAVGELAGKPVGLEKRASEAKTFYGVLTAAMIAGLAITLLKVNIIEALFYTAVINGVAAAPIMIITMIIASRQEIMGSYTIPIYLKIGGWTASLLMLVAAVAMFF